MKLGCLVAGASLLVGCGASQIGELDGPHQQLDEHHQQPASVPADAPTVEATPEQVDAFFCTQWTWTDSGEDWFIICGLSPANCEELKESERPYGNGAFGACLRRSEAVCVRVEADGQETEKCTTDPVVCSGLESMYKYRGGSLVVRCRRISALELEGMRRHGHIPGAEP